MPALVNADSIRLIQISMLALSKLGRSTFRGTSRKSEGCTVGAEGVGVGCISLTASNDCETEASVAAFTVASTRALIEAASIFEGDDGVETKKGSSLGVGEGDGVLVARFLILVCGDGKR